MQIKGSISYYDNATLKVNIIGYIKECYINAALMQHKFTLMQHYQIAIKQSKNRKLSVICKGDK